VFKLRRGGTKVEVQGLDASSAKLVEQFAIYPKNESTSYVKLH
jgi:SulP family sulfate permease